MKPTIGGGWGSVTPQKMIHSSTIKQTGKIPMDEAEDCGNIMQVAGVNGWGFMRACHVFDKNLSPQHQIPQYQ